MSETDTIIEELDTTELKALMGRVEHAIANDLALSTADMKLLLSAVITLATLQTKIEDKDITLHKLRKLLGIVQQSEKRRNTKKSTSKGKNNKKPKAKRKPKSPKTEPTIVHHKMTELHKGETCPECHRGTLCKHEFGKLLRITGHSPYEAVKHITEQLRCNGCQAIYKAPLPKEVLEDGDANQMYGYSARTLMVIDKFYSGLPYYHQGNLSQLFGMNISSSTIFDQCEYVANAVMPIFYVLQRLAGNGKSFLLDDTHNRILEQQPELRDKPNGKGKQLRSGIYSSGLIAILDSGHEIILFETSLGHAGEHLDKILEKRHPELPAPLTMSDALSSNAVTKVTVQRSLCNAHARRQFFDLEKLYPEEIGWVLETYGTIWKIEAEVKEQGLNDDERLAYHQEHSLPAMEAIKDWALKRQASPAFEENNAMGKAIKYFLRHYEELTLFCKVPGARIDNNPMEEKLKIVIRGRKTAHFYKTVVGADVANVLISLIATTHTANENLYEYFQALQKNQKAIKENPEDWLPWTYRDTMKKLKAQVESQDSS